MFKEHGIKEKKKVQHPIFPFVYIFGKEYSCIQHPELARMNKGSMRQHIEGKKHGLNFDTGEHITKTEHIPVDFDEQIRGGSNQTTKTESGTEPFWELKEKLDTILPGQAPIVAFLLAKYCFKGELGEDVLFYLQFILYMETQGLAQKNYFINS